MQLNNYLIKEIQRGRAVLFLGSGASKGAEHPHGSDIPDANQLARLISDEFLGGEFKSEPLAIVSELAMSASNLFLVQDFIANIFREFRPAKFHYHLQSFNWRAIVTTNYDLLVEDVFSNQQDCLKKLIPFLSNKDKFDQLLRSENALPYLKLHGCISRPNDESLPLILTPDQYVKFKDGRVRLFNKFFELGFEYPVIFVGQGLQDPNLRQILLELQEEHPQGRPPYYLIKPNISDTEKSFWLKKNIHAISGTFEEFLSTIDQQISKEFRSISVLLPTDHPIKNRFIGNQELSTSTFEFLRNDADFIHAGMRQSPGSAKAFYKGFDLQWFPIQQKLDVQRDLTDTFIFDVILGTKAPRPNVEFYVVKAEAGAGKTIFLRRVAWTAAVESDEICIFLREYGIIDYEPLAEIYRLTDRRIFVFIDNAADHVAELEYILDRALRDQISLTLISAERINAWNMNCESLMSYVTDTFELSDLTLKESKALLELLDKHDSLGRLKSFSQEDRVTQFRQHARSQLLVALYESTLGKPFVETLIDEFNEIYPDLAQHIYLGICVLYRFNIFVRAGLISRVFDVPFTRFKEELFSPLEHVVQVIERNPAQDYLYAARHPEIATIVFEHILKSSEARFDYYVRILQNMNISFETDRLAFRRLIRGRALLDSFPDHQQVVEILKIAEKISPSDPYLLQQQGIYEMNRPNGNFDLSHRLLASARLLAKQDKSIVHSLAELARKRVRAEQSPFKREQYRKESISLASSLLDDTTHRLYGRYTLASIQLDKLEDLTNDASEREREAIISEIENQLNKGLQEFPDDSNLLAREARFKKLIHDYEGSIHSLRKAFDQNRRNIPIATRLAKAYEENGNSDEATEVIRVALESNRGAQELHFRYATLLRKHSERNLDLLIYHFRHAFTPGDKNFDAQFWYARYCFESDDDGKQTEAREYFERLRTVRIHHDIKIKVRDRILDKGRPKIFSGTILSKEQSYGFVALDGSKANIFLHNSYVDSGTWGSLAKSQRVRFNIGFSFQGPLALDLKL